ncbi:hypothetical protein V2I60_19680 [Pseudomonas viridiflava]|uniref:hypothetical protein n=1 Tax=Pseudomonas viridiflava TaxID=33069 RepID=UPI002E9933BC|nr:hypothetical protein [Pseudomonas viridiflava]
MTIGSCVRFLFRGLIFVCMLFFLFLVLLVAISFSFTLSSAETAAWVQAFGSIAAILGAVSISAWQSRGQERERQRVHEDRTRRVLGILLSLAKSQQEQLETLHHALYKSVEDFGHNSINPYLEGNWHLKWPAHSEALRSIDINELDADLVKRLIEMKVGADFAWSICERLGLWDPLGSREQNDIRMVRHYLEMSGLLAALLKQRRDSSS